MAFNNYLGVAMPIGERWDALAGRQALSGF